MALHLPLLQCSVSLSPGCHQPSILENICVDGCADELDMWSAYQVATVSCNNDSNYQSEFAMSTMSKTCLGTVFWLFDIKGGVELEVLFLLISLTIVAIVPSASVLSTFERL